MKIGFIGSGNVAKTLGYSLVKLGHEVKLGARSPEKIKEWLKQFNSNKKISVGSFQEAAKHGEIVINATIGTASLKALNKAKFWANHLTLKFYVKISEENE